MPTPQSVYWRRRAIALAGLAGVVVVGLVLLTGAGGSPPAGPASVVKTEGAAARGTPESQLPRGGRRIFPRSASSRSTARRRTTSSARSGSARRRGRRGGSRPSRRRTRAGRARRCPRWSSSRASRRRTRGDDGLFRLRQSDAVVERYLRAARRAKALLVLDIQPGHADFLAEAQHLERWLREPDVGLALDPEWHTPGKVPGTAIGSVDARTVNAVSAWLARIVVRDKLPEKLFVVHQFTKDMIRDKARVKPRPGLAITMNVDGFGDRPNKLAKYAEFTRDGTRFNDGFKLFYKEDTNLMTPGAVLDLRPPPDLVVYE